MAECWHKNNPQGQHQAFKSDMLVTQTQPPSALSLPVVQEQSTSYSRDTDEYTPFISRGYISIPGSTSKISITVLRGTGANQSLLIETKLPCAAEISTGCEVLIQGGGT